MTRTDDDLRRIDRLAGAGKLTPGQASRLAESVKAEHLRAATFEREAARAGRRNRRRAWWLTGLFGVLFLLGLGTGMLARDEGMARQAYPGAAVKAQVAEPPPGRTIDLSSLDQERRTTMNRTRTLSVAVVLLMVVVLLGGGFLLLYNNLVSSRERVNAGWAQVENVYQRRLDLVPVLVDSVMTYMEHERETLAELTKARARAVEVSGMLGGQAPQTAEQLKAVEASQGAVKSALARLFAVVENYPDLKASQNFLALQDQVEGTENRITVERRNYNEFARRYNTRIQTFPANIVAEMGAFEPKPYFEAETAALQGLRDPFGRDGG